MSRAYLCDKCKVLTTRKYAASQETVDKVDDKSVVVDLTIMSPSNYDICEECGAEYFIKGLNNFLRRLGGVASIKWERKEVERVKEGDITQAATKPPSKNFKQPQTKGEKTT